MSLRKYLSKRLGNTDGYLLPVVIALGLGVSTISVLALRTVGDSSYRLNTQQYEQFAREAAKAGIAVATKCIEKNPTAPLWAGGLQNSSCTSVGAPDSVASTTEFDTQYSVDATGSGSVGAGTIVLSSTGIVKLKAASGAVVQTIRETVRGFAKLSPGTPPTITTASSLSTGTATACAVNNDWVYCWGSNSEWQLGNGRYLAYDRSTVPVAVANNSATQAVIPGVCVSYSFGNCWSWRPADTPAQPASAMAGKRAIKVSVGADHTCAVATEADGSNGRVYCWGRNDNGQLGNTTRTDSLVPVAPTTNTAAIPADPGDCARRSVFTGNCLQWNREPTPAYPRSAITGKVVTDVVAGDRFTCVLMSDNMVSCWGRNNNGQLGNGNRTDTPHPAAVSTSMRFKKLAQVKGSATTMCAITTTDQLACWGLNKDGHMGVAYSVEPTQHDATHRQSNENACRSAEAEARERAMRAAQAAGPPESSKIETTPVLTDTSQRFDSVLVINNEMYAKSITTQKLHSWSMSYQYSYEIISSRCVRNGETYGSGHAMGYATAERTIVDTTTTEGSDSYPSQVGLYSGSPRSTVFCAQTGGDVFCEKNTESPRSGQLGNGVSYACGFGCPAIPSTPVLVNRSIMTNSLAIEAMDSGMGEYTCAMAAGAPYCWGVNSSGQLGDGTTTSRNIPTQVAMPGGGPVGGGGSAAIGPPRNWVYF